MLQKARITSFASQTRVKKSYQDRLLKTESETWLGQQRLWYNTNTWSNFLNTHQSFSNHLNKFLKKSGQTFIFLLRLRKLGQLKTSDLKNSTARFKANTWSSLFEKRIPNILDFEKQCLYIELISWSTLFY